LYILLVIQLSYIELAGAKLVNRAVVVTELGVLVVLLVFIIVFVVMLRMDGAVMQYVLEEKCLLVAVLHLLPLLHTLVVLAFLHLVVVGE
jgi:hypothetical protein